MTTHSATEVAPNSMTVDDLGVDSLLGGSTSPGWDALSGDDEDDGSSQQFSLPHAGFPELQAGGASERVPCMGDGTLLSCPGP